MTQPLLAAQFRNGTPQVYRIVQAQPIALGGALPGETAETVQNDSNAHFMNRVVRFENGVYCWQNTHIYKFDNVSSWSAVHTLANQGANNLGNHSGLHKCDINGVPAIIGIYNNTQANQWWGIYSLDGASWTEVNLTSFIPNNLNNAFHRSFIWQNQLWFEHENNDTFFWDPTSGSVGSVTIPTSTGYHDFCVHKNRLYAFGQENSANIRNSLMEFVAGTWFTRVSGIGGGTNDGGNPVGHCIFPGGDGFLYVLTFVTSGVSNPGAKAFQCSVASDGTVTPTEITSSVIPTIYRPGGGLVTNTSRYWAFVDTDSSPGSAPDIWVFYASQGAITASTTLFQWLGPSTLMNQIDVGGAVEMAFPEAKNGGGEYIFTIGQNDVMITGKSPVIGGERISFKLYGGGTVSFSMFHGTNGEAPTAISTLSNPSAGTLNGNNQQVDGLTADGTTTYQVTWLASTDGVANQTRVQRLPRVF